MKLQKDTPLLWIGWVMLVTYCSLAFGQSATDNVIMIQQSGNNLNLDIVQDGYGNKVRDLNSTTGDATLNGASLNLNIDMVGNNNDIGLWTSGSNQIMVADILGNNHA